MDEQWWSLIEGFAFTAKYRGRDSFGSEDNSSLWVLDGRGLHSHLFFWGSDSVLTELNKTD